MSSIREVAKRAGVSIGSVSRYLNGQQLKTINMKKIQTAIDELDYKENIIAKGLKNNKSFSVGLLMNSISSQFGAQIVSAIEDIIEKNGYSILLSGFQGDISKIDKKIDYLLQHAVDGLIIFVSEQEWDGIERLISLDIPVLTINSPSSLPDVDCIQVDDYKSAKTVVNAIIEKGHKRIGIIAAPQNDFVARNRLRGAEMAATKYSDVELITIIGDYSRISGYLSVEKLLKKKITALFVTNYNMAMGVLEFLQYTKNFNTKQLLLAHYDYTDEIVYVRDDRIIIKTPTQKIGQLCAERLLQRMEKSSFLPSETIIIENEIFGLPLKE